VINMKRITVSRVLLALVLTALYSDAAAAQQKSDRASMLREIQELRSRLNKLEEGFLAPSQKDRGDYSEFLRGADTGLFRLLPREDFDKPDRLTIRGGGAYYSFSDRNNEYANGTDIELQQGNLSVGFAGANYGMIATLGEISLEEVTLDTPTVALLASHVPPTLLSEARVEQRRVGEGFELGPFQYRNRIHATVNSSYVLRSVNYHNSDVLVAIRVLRKDSDGSLVLAWKLLKKYSVPNLVHDKSEG
jgi:hypothetical protein